MRRARGTAAAPAALLVLVMSALTLLGPLYVCDARAESHGREAGVSAVGSPHQHPCDHRGAAMGTSCRYDDLSQLARAFARVDGYRSAPRSALGDLRPAEVWQIQSVVNEAGRPLEVVGSAARGSRRGVGSNLPIGKGPGTRSDIDYLVPHGSLPHYETTGLHKNLPDLDRIVPGVHNPHIGPAIRFEPWMDPFFVPGAPG